MGANGRQYRSTQRERCLVDDDDDDARPHEMLRFTAQEIRLGITAKPSGHGVFLSEAAPDTITVIVVARAQIKCAELSGAIYANFNGY